MIASPTLLLAVQAEGIGLNTVTFGVVSAVVLALAGAITVLFRMVTASDRQQIIDLKAEKRELEQENRELMDALIDSLRTGHRAADVAVDATSELMKRQAKRPK